MPASLRSAGAAVPQTLRHGLIAAADGGLDQFTGSGPIVKLGVLFKTTPYQSSPALTQSESALR
jgi:hypothetical protein